MYALKVMKKVGEMSSAYFSEERDIMARYGQCNVMYVSICHILHCVRNTSPWLTKLDYAFQDGAYLYLAMEYHCGGDLLGLMERMDNNLDEDSVR